MQSKTVYGNYPSFTIRCAECKSEFHPADSKQKTCGCVSVRSSRKPLSTSWDEANGMPSIPMDDETRSKRVAEITAASFAKVNNCGCEPCPVDIRTLGFDTAKEDPAFEGTQCLWHEQIVGRKGIIFVSGGTVESPLFISADRDGVYLKENFGLSEVPEQATRIGA